jgi:hypothetical protein
MKTTIKNHSLPLSDWGPYTKRYIGISHVADALRGLRLDLSVFPGRYRRGVEVPNVNWESGFHPWEAAADLSYFSFRHQVEWKDRVYCDTSYCRLDGRARLIRCTCVNNTDLPQTLCLHYLASMNFPAPTIYSQETLRPWRVTLPPGGVWVDAVDYEDLRFARPRPTDNLVPDGLFRGETCGHGFVGPSGLGQGFGRDPGDSVRYRCPLPAPLPAAALVIRYRLPKGQSTAFELQGAATGTLTLHGDGTFQTQHHPLPALSGATCELTLRALGPQAIEIDGFAIVPAQRLDAVHFEPVVYDPTPKILPGPLGHSLILKYADVPQYYGLVWGFPDFVVRQFHYRDIDVALRHLAHDHVRTDFPGDGLGHYTNVFLRPVAVPARQQRILDALVCAGDLPAVERELAQWPQRAAAADPIHRSARAAAAQPPGTPAGQKYVFSQRLMQATTLSGVVYPIYTQRQYIKHYTPGRWWDCLYTWDAGFLGLGLLEHDPRRAADCLNAYLTDPDNGHAAFLHHGSPVPTQFLLFLDLWNRTQCRAWLEQFYPSLRHYYLFMAGKAGSSTTGVLKSGLLKTWDYFYNTGWDDYPPQLHMHRHGLTGSVAPMITTSLVARAARVLQMAATALGLADHAAEYQTHIDSFTQAVQRHAWDGQAGYFSYVTHDPAGQAAGPLRHESGANYNLGLDGVMPLCGGLCTPHQAQRLLGHLRDDRQLWSPIGLSAVDQSAPYYRRDGYWNGTVWFPHQWLIWKALLDLGQADAAWQIAQRALDLWQRETDESYHCFEHFVIETGRGAGWHQFTGLSSPVMAWYGAYFRPGRLSCGFDVWVERHAFAPDATALEADLRHLAPAGQSPAVLVCLAPGREYSARWNGAPVACPTLLPGVVSVQLPPDTPRGRLQIA